jgi:hypothetical protein
MPCRDSAKFPAIFPANFEPDTLYLHQALAEYNYALVAAGLSTQNYFQLSDADRHAVIARANEIKFASRAKVIPMKVGPDGPEGNDRRRNVEDTNRAHAPFLVQHKRKYLDAASMSISTLGYVAFAAGAFILTLALLHYL